MKKLILTLLIFLLFLSVNACYKTENDLSIKEPDETVFQGITLSLQDHPELMRISATSGHPFRKHPDSVPVISGQHNGTSGHLVV
jgi:hypothetical protein